MATVEQRSSTRSSSWVGRASGLAASPAKSSSSYSRAEGPRGVSTRAAVFARHVAYFVVVLLGSSVANFCFVEVGKYQLGGKLMWAMSSLTVVSGALATVFYVNQRNEILEQVRHYVFGLMVLPGTVLALIMWGANLLAGGSGAGVEQDQFLKIILISLPMLYFCTVVIPPVLFIKMLAGIRTLHRSHCDDEDMVNRWTRQDQFQT